MTSATSANPNPSEPPTRDRRATYLGVLLVEAAVIAALWVFSRHFGG
jgi:hypothetical protein